MTTQGAVAVIIPAHNRRHMVTKAVASVLAQTHHNLRCIVVDNGSNDGTSAAVGVLNDPRLTVISDPRPLGPSQARNVGAAASSDATWVTFLDSDDYWAPDKVEQQLKALVENPAAGWCATSGVSVGTGLDVRFATRLQWGDASRGKRFVVSQADMLNLLRDDNMIPAGGSNVLVSRQLFEAVGGFDAELPTNEDWDLWLKLAKESPLAYVDAPLVGYQIWEGQTSSSHQRFLDTAELVRSRHLPEAGPLPRQYELRWDLEVARRHVAAGRRIAAARCYLRVAVAGRAPGQLAYAATAVVSPRLAEWRLRRVETTRALPEGWKEQVEPWLACWRSE